MTDRTVTDAELLAAADAAAERAYAPYSSFDVGCAVLARDGTVVEGVNVENAAYPLGICAERVPRSGARSRWGTGRATSSPRRSPPPPAAAAGSGCSR